MRYFTKMFDIISPLTWLVMLELLGILVFPITFVTLKNLKDRGYAVSKIISILLVSYLSWMIVNTGALPYGEFSIYLAIALLLFPSLYFFGRNNQLLPFPTVFCTAHQVSPFSSLI